jgi:hypothetical protein
LPDRQNAVRLLAIAGLAVSVLAVTLVAVAGPGTRFGFWGFRTGLLLLRYVAMAAIGGAVLGLVSALLGSRAIGGAALVLGLLALGVPVAFFMRARGVPRIHDITTDTVDPPAFERVLGERAASDNPAVYGGEEIAREQRTAYPDLTRALVADAPTAAFERALAVAHDLGWKIVAADPSRGVIEATDTTFWYGFKDDVVIRVRAEGAGSRVDVRSASRVGKSDLGANAQRIRRFLDRLRR